jgi:polar amino acid transport system substrate-binding protein
MQEEPGLTKSLVGILLATFAATAIGAQTLVVGFNEGNAEPYAFISGNTMTGGIIKDIGDAVARELNIKVEYKISTPNRIKVEVKDGTIHVLPIFNPAWTPSPNDFNWTSVLFPETNIFVTSKARPLAIKGFDDLKGKRIGTIQGYYYPTLDPYFKKGDMVRDDAGSLQQNFDKLKAGRIDALIDSNVILSYKLKSLGADFQASTFVAASQDIYFGLSKTLPVDGAKLLAAFEKIKKSGELDSILKKYR